MAIEPATSIAFLAARSAVANSDPTAGNVGYTPWCAARLATASWPDCNAPLAATSPFRLSTASRAICTNTEPASVRRASVTGDSCVAMRSRLAATRSTGPSKGDNTEPKISTWVPKTSVQPGKEEPAKPKAAAYSRK